MTLNYTLITDPAPLEAPAAGAASTGTVYLVVTNTGRTAVSWSTIKVEVPVGDGLGHLTPNINTIKPKGEYTDKSGTQPVNIQRQGTTNAFQATPLAGGKARFANGGYMVLTLGNVTVAATAGLAVLRVTEAPSGNATAVALVKIAPKKIPAPRNFRPKESMVDAGTDIVLSWDGPADFNYEIHFPGGKEAVNPVKGGIYKWSPSVGIAPKRATTFTLVARPSSGQGPGYFLTTTVHLRNPTFETLTVTKGVQGGNAGDGRITFQQGGLHVYRDGSEALGAAYVNGVHTAWVQGGNADDGRITFPKSGLNVYQNGSENWGTVTADKAYFNNVFTPWIGGPTSGDGTITFPQGGVTVWRTGGASEQGTLFADTAEVSSVKTYKVVGKNADGGWITFPPGGMNVHQASARWGVVGALRFGVRSND
jgi:hypothetical protein